MKLLERKTIIITGTSRGMGKEMVSIFAKNGANVIAHARTLTEEHADFCKKLEESTEVKVIPLYFDLGNMDDIKEAVKKIKALNFEIDGLVNNAGIISHSMFQMTRIEELNNLFQVNFFAPFVFTQYISKFMIRNKKGSIVNIASAAAQDGYSGKAAYGASKAALLTMTLSIAEELGPLGIRANAICPGYTETDMVSSLPEYVSNSQKEATFLKKLGTPKDVANVAMYLLSDYASYITGQVIRVDGGMTQYTKRK